MGIRPFSWAKGRSRTQAGILYKRMVLWLDLRGFTVQLSYPNFPLVYPNWGTVTAAGLSSWRTDVRRGAHVSFVPRKEETVHVKTFLGRHMSLAVHINVCV